MSLPDLEITPVFYCTKEQVYLVSIMCMDGRPTILPLLVCFLNQGQASLWLTCTWFLHLYVCRVCMCVHVCVCMYLPQRLLLTSGVICTPYDWLKVDIVSGGGLSFDACHRNQSNKSYLAL